MTFPRRKLAWAALAASLLIVCSLAYPYFRGPRLSPVSMNESATQIPASQKQIAAATQIVETDKQVSELVESFNHLIQEQRYDEAAVVAQRVKEVTPESPISVTMMQSGQAAQRLSEMQAPKPQALNAPAEDPFGDSLGVVDEFAATSGGIQGSVTPGRLSGLDAEKSIRQFDSRYDFGIRPGQSESRDQSDGDGREDAEMLYEMNDDANDGVDPAAKPARQARRSRRSRSTEDMMEMMGGDEEMMEMKMGDMGGMMMGMGGPGMGGAGGGMSGGMGMDSGAELGFPGVAGLPIVDRIAADPRGDRFDPIEDNPFAKVSQSPLSTFSIDVDTASYAKVRSLLNQNSLPRPDAVRIEEFLNYFDYDYDAPTDEHPFAASMEIAACPWNAGHRLARIGIQGKEIEAERPSSNLVFLLDVSGSMDEPNKLSLVIEGMKMLTDQLTENDKVAIVVYAGAAGLVLDATRGHKKQQIVASLDRLKAGGSTNGGQGIVLAYELARDNFIVGGTNRVILCSDGDFNVGVTGTDQLVKIAQENAKSNIFLSVLGFGIGNHNDAMMEQISNKGNGNYAFIDTKSEAKKVLVEELGSTLVTIAKDVKIQIEFNPKHVASYRLIGYENRMLEAEDFNDDKKDAGEIGAGHTVTALYEVVTADSDDADSDDTDVSPVDELRYQKRIKLSKAADSGEMLVLKLRYKQPEGTTSTLMEIPVSDSGKGFAQTDRDFKFAASVAAFGMLLRDSPHKGDATMAGVAELAREGAKGDDFGYRNEFVDLVQRAKQLRGE